MTGESLAPEAATSPDDEALRWFVRSRAADFSADEKRRLDAWLAASPAHREAFDGLHATWTRLDDIEGLLPGQLRAPAPHRPAFSLARFLPLGGALAAAAMLLLAILPRYETLQSFEALPGQHREITLADGTRMTLDADSAVTVTDALPPRVELVRGNAYFEVAGKSSGQLEVRAGATRIRDIGTRFAVSLRAERGSVAVAEGQVEIKDSRRLILLAAGRGADLDPQGIAGERAIAESDIAPWRLGIWRFAATPLAELAAELERQQRIRLDIPDPHVAALTVSGSFPIQEPDRVLWAVAQVHGLKLQRLDERHYQLRRG